MTTTDTSETVSSFAATGDGWVHRLRRMLFRKPSPATAAIYGGVGIILLLTIIGPNIGPWLADAGCACGWGDEEIDAGRSLEAPSGTHFFGTDRSGLDVFSRVLSAPRINLVIALAATALSVAIGVPLGLLAGYIGGRTFAATAASEIIMRFMDVLQSFPLFRVCGRPRCRPRAIHGDRDHRLNHREPPGLCASRPSGDAHRPRAALLGRCPHPRSRQLPPDLPAPRPQLRCLQRGDGAHGHRLRHPLYGQPELRWRRREAAYGGVGRHDSVSVPTIWSPGNGGPPSSQGLLSA